MVNVETGNIATIPTLWDTTCRSIAAIPVIDMNCCANTSRNSGLPAWGILHYTIVLWAPKTPLPSSAQPPKKDIFLHPPSIEFNDFLCWNTLIILFLWIFPHYMQHFCTKWWVYIPISFPILQKIFREKYLSSQKHLALFLGPGMIEIVWLFSSESKVIWKCMSGNYLITSIFHFFVESTQKEDILPKLASFKVKRTKCVL